MWYMEMLRRVNLTFSLHIQVKSLFKIVPGEFQEIWRRFSRVLLFVTVQKHLS